MSRRCWQSACVFRLMSRRCLDVAGRCRDVAVLQCNSISCNSMTAPFESVEPGRLPSPVFARPSPSPSPTPKRRITWPTAVAASIVEAESASSSSRSPAGRLIPAARYARLGHKSPSPREIVAVGSVVWRWRCAAPAAWLWSTKATQLDGRRASVLTRASV